MRLMGLMGLAYNPFNPISPISPISPTQSYSAQGPAAGSQINAYIVVPGVDNVNREAAVRQGLDHSGRGQRRQSPPCGQNHCVSQSTERAIPHELFAIQVVTFRICVSLFEP